MAEKTTPKIVINQPKYNDITQYNFIGSPFLSASYRSERNQGLPENNDKFSEKDLYTTSEGHYLNEEIMFQNIKFPGESFVRVDNCFVGHTGVNYKVIDIDIRCYLFSHVAADNAGFNPLNDSYDTLADKLHNSNFEIFRKTYGNRESDIGNILSNAVLISQLGLGETVKVGNFDGVDTEYSPTIALEKVNTNEPNTVIDQAVPNSLYFVVWMKGNADLPWPRGHATRKRKFQIFTIGNELLFDDGGNGRTNEPLVFNESSARILTGGGDGGTDAPAWQCESLQLTFDTRAGVAGQELHPNSKRYQRYVKPSVSLYLNNPLSFLNQSPDRGLFNNETSSLYRSDIDGGTFIQDPRDGAPGFANSKGFRDYFPIAFVSPMDVDGPLSTPYDNYYDLSKYPKSDADRLIASAPTTVALSFVVRDLPHESERTGNWNDEMSINYYNTGSGGTIYLPGGSYGYVGSLDSMLYYYVLDWNDKDDKIKTFEDALKLTPSNKADLLALQEQNKFKFKVFESTTNPGESVSGSMLTHNYNTPGIKTIKAIMVSFNRQPFQDTNPEADPDEPNYVGGPFEAGRWKLITTKFFLDIPINQYPDFDELGGNYTTLPWPFTTPIIGGMTDDSRYKKSIRQTLSSGKVGKNDIIDERFLLADINNEEMGVNILNFDLEQVRYFDKNYSLDSLLMLDTMRGGVGSKQYDTSEEHLSTLEGFNGSGMNNAEAQLLTTQGWNEYGRPDIAMWAAQLQYDEEQILGGGGPSDDGELEQGQLMGGGGGPGDGAMPTAGQGMGPGDGEEGQLFGEGDGSGGDFECFVAGTKIRMKSGLEKNIEDIQIGEEVLSYNIHTKKLEPKKVTKLFTQVHDLVDGDITTKTKFNNGVETHNTIANPFWSKDKGFVAADAERCNRLHQWVKETNKGKDTEQLEVGDTLYYHNGEELEEVMVTDIENILEPDVRTYDITVEDNHTFFANGILTHNSGGGGGGVPDPGEGEEEGEGEGPDDDAIYKSIQFSTDPGVQINDVYRNQGFGTQDEPDKIQIRWELGGYGSAYEHYNDNVDGDNGLSGEYQQAYVRIYLMVRDGDKVVHYPSMLTPEESSYFPEEVTKVYEGFGVYINGHYWAYYGSPSADAWQVPYEGIEAGTNYTFRIENGFDEVPENSGNDQLVAVDMYGRFEIKRFNHPPVPEEPRPLETFYNPIYWLVSATLENKYSDTDFWDGSTPSRTFPHESSVGQIFISENQDNVLKQNCKVELNTSNITGKSIYDSSGHRKKGLLIGDYKIKKTQKGRPMRRDSSIKVPTKGPKNKGAL